MKSCPDPTELQSYYDKQLPTHVSAELEQHLQSCEACQTELASMEAMSLMFTQSALPELRPLALAQMHLQLDTQINQQLKRKAEQGPLQLAQWLTAAAAVVLLVCSIQLLFLQNSQSTSSTAFDVTPGLAWETTTAMLNQQNPAEPAATDEHSMAAWIVSDLSASTVSSSPLSSQE